MNRFCNTQGRLHALPSSGKLSGTQSPASRMDSESTWRPRGRLCVCPLTENKNETIMADSNLQMTPVTPEQIDAILPFLPRLEEEGFVAGEWKGRPGQFPWFQFSDETREFLNALNLQDWVSPQCRWTEWQDTAKTFIDTPSNIETADAQTIRRLFTTHVRANRFCEGHLAAMFESGHMLLLLKRLKTIRTGIGEL
ncbi:DUF6508 domain-containing protein [Neorhodopirellula lusitana]|uniref:DUF6508 domain-containing protein n=1 Tax=Neorhodopirellula lusitana TaxID=445327 RepID=UPI00384EE282